MVKDRVHYLDREFMYRDDTQTWDEVVPGTEEFVEVSAEDAYRRDRLVAAIHNGQPDGAPDLVYRLVLDERTGQYVGVEIARRDP